MKPNKTKHIHMILLLLWWWWCFWWHTLHTHTHSFFVFGHAHSFFVCIWNFLFALVRVSFFIVQYKLVSGVSILWCKFYENERIFLMNSFGLEFGYRCWTLERMMSRTEFIKKNMKIYDMWHQSDSCHISDFNSNNEFQGFRAFKTQCSL